MRRTRAAWSSSENWLTRWRSCTGQGVRHFICGMATGCDMFFAEAVLALRERRPDVTLEAAVPCEEQDRRWTHGLSERYDRLLAECDSRTLVSPRLHAGVHDAPQPLHGR